MKMISSDWIRISFICLYWILKRNLKFLFLDNRAEKPWKYEKKNEQMKPVCMVNSVLG